MQPPTDSVTLPVEGMTCGGCVASVERALRRLPGVVSAAAQLSPGAVTVTRAAGGPSEAALAAAIVDAGFGVPGR